MKTFALTTLFAASAFAIGTNEYDSYFYDDAWLDWEDLGLSTSWNGDHNPLRIGGAGDFDLELMDWTREDKEGRYLSGTYGPSFNAFFNFELDVFILYALDFNLKFFMNGFKMQPVQYKFVKTFGEGKCYYLSTTMKAASFDLVMRESVAEYYISMADIFEDGFGTSAEDYIRFNADQSEYVKWPEVDSIYTAWEKEINWFKWCR